MFTDIEQAIADKLNDAPELTDVTIMTAADLASVTEDRQPTPAVHVIYQNYSVLETRPDGKAASIQQSWLVVCTAKDVRNIRSGEASRLAAGELAERVLPELMGWQAPKAAGPLVLSTPPQPAYAKGITYLPLAFTVKTVIKTL
jgi:hypothetical protein